MFIHISDRQIEVPPPDISSIIDRMSFGICLTFVLNFAHILSYKLRSTSVLRILVLSDSAQAFVVVSRNSIPSRIHYFQSVCMWPYSYCKRAWCFGVKHICYSFCLLRNCQMWEYVSDYGQYTYDQAHGSGRGQKGHLSQAPGLGGSQLYNYLI
jgi:hypothetical protein